MNTKTRDECPDCFYHGYCSKHGTARTWPPRVAMSEVEELRAQVEDHVYNVIRSYGGSLQHLAHQGADIAAEAICEAYSSALAAAMQTPGYEEHMRVRRALVRGIERLEQENAKLRSAWEAALLEATTAKEEAAYWERLYAEIRAEFTTTESAHLALNRFKQTLTAFGDAAQDGDSAEWDRLYMELVGMYRQRSGRGE